MDFRNYLRHSVVSKGLSQNQFGSLTKGNADYEILSKISLFSSANLEEVQNLDWAKLLEDIASNANATEDASSEVPAEAAAGDASALEEIVKELMGLEDVQSFIDADANGEVNEEEAKEFFQSLMSQDGDSSTFTYDDIDKAFEQFGINLAEIADSAVDEVLKSFDEVSAADEAAKTEAAKTEAAKAEATPETKKTNSGSGSSGGGGYNAGSSSSAKKTQQKSASDELSDLESKREACISDADKNIQAAEQKKYDLINNNSKISGDIKEQYDAAKKELQETQKSRKETDKKSDDLDKKISGLDQSIAALEGEKANLQTDTGDEKIDSENKARLSEINSSLSAKKEEKEKLEQELKETKEKIQELEETETEQTQTLTDLETKMSAMDPALKTQLSDANSDIQSLKAEKTKNVAEYDKQIKAKRSEAVDEAKKAGESKGKAASNMGSALIDIASKYLGLNEGDNSYKLFTDGRTEAWCADFVTYVVNEFADSKGMNVKDGFGSPAVADLRDWAINHGVYNDITQMTFDEKQEFMLDELKAGDIIIWKRNGLSHTGFIKCVIDDGTFETVEGNTKDAVRINTRKIGSDQLSGFIKLSDVVE